MKTFACLVLAMLALPAFATDSPDLVAEAWNSAKARQDLGFVLFSYYHYSVEGGEDPEGGFDADLDSFLGSQGREGDCALVHALWFDMGEGTEADIVDEIANRGEHMLPVIAFALQELAMGKDQPGGDCGVVVRLDQASIRDIYNDCVKEIRGDIARQSI
jgi:hypothetical protein